MRLLRPFETLYDSGPYKRGGELREYIEDLEHFGSDSKPGARFEITAAEITAVRGPSGALTVTAKIPNKPLLIRDTERRRRLELWGLRGHPQRAQLKRFVERQDWRQGKEETFQFIGRMSAGGAITVATTKEDDGSEARWVLLGRKDRQNEKPDPKTRVIHWGYLVPQSGLSERTVEADERRGVEPCWSILDPILICADEATEEICLRDSGLRRAFEPLYHLPPAFHDAQARTRSIAHTTFAERLEWDVERKRVYPDASDNRRTVDAEYISLGDDTLIVKWKKKVWSERVGKVVLDPDCPAVDLMCGWQVRFDKLGMGVTGVRFLDGEGHARELYNREVFVLTPQQLYSLFVGGEHELTVMRDKVPDNQLGINRRECLTRMHGPIPANAALNPPLIGAGMELLRTFLDRNGAFGPLPSEAALFNRCDELGNCKRDWRFPEAL